MSIGLMVHGFWFRGLGLCYLYRSREADNSVATLYSGGQILRKSGSGVSEVSFPT